MAVPELDLWLNGTRVATTTTAARSGAVRISYTRDARERFADGTLLLSCSLPTPEPSPPGNARAFLEGLLPEGRALEAAAAGLRGVSIRDGSPAAPGDAVTLLAEYGRDCAGAVAAVPAGDAPPGPGWYEPVNSQRLTAIIRDLPRHPLGADPERGIRMCLAGVQPKFVLARFRGKWFLPIGGAASTHILKPSVDWPHSAHNEALVIALARAAALTDCAAWVETADDGVAVLVTARYDRRVQGRTVTRRHQEDVCQALGLRPRDKYHVGRPSEQARKLRRLADDPEALTRAMFRQLAFRAIAGDEDGHGKNTSLLLDDGVVSLAPLYDSLCTLVYPELTGRMAAPIGGQEKLTKVDRNAMMREAHEMGLPPVAAAAILDQLAEQLRVGLRDLPSRYTDGWPAEMVTETIGARLERLHKGESLGEAVTFSPARRRRRTTGPG